MSLSAIAVNVDDPNGGNGITADIGIYASGSDDAENATEVLLTASHSNEIKATDTGIKATAGADVSLSAEGGNYIRKSAEYIKDAEAYTGIEADGGATVSFKATTGENGIAAADTGIKADNGAKVSLIADSQNNTITAGSTGINAAGEDTTVYLTAYSGSNKITADDGAGTSIKADDAKVELKAGSNTITGLTTATGSGTIEITGTSSNTFSSSATFDDTENLVASALYAAGNGNITVSGGQNTISVTTDENASAVAVYASDHGQISITGVVGIESPDVAVQAVGPAAESDSAAGVTISYNGDSSITGDLIAADYGVLAVDLSADATGRLEVTGDIKASNQGTARVNLGEGGVLTGSINNYLFAANTAAGTAELTMGTNSYWKMTDSSVVTTITTVQDLLERQEDGYLDLNELYSSDLGYLTSVPVIELPYFGDLDNHTSG